jgi:isopropylmalate/homocitrate/citramalate synthase
MSPELSTSAEARDRLAGRASELGLCDVTLRDGEQAVAAAFTPREKLDVATRLDELGVHQVQAGFPSADGLETVRLMKAGGLSVPVELLCVAARPDWEADIGRAIDVGADVVQVLVRSSDALLEFWGSSREDALERAQTCIAFARERGARTVVLGTSFSTQADPAFLRELAVAGVAAGADRVSLADTVGIGRPAAIAALVEGIASATGVPVGIHCHNDFGLATACTLAAFEAGASWADVSVGGLGERSGNASLEQVAVALRFLYGADVGVATDGLCALAHFVAGVLRAPLAADKPVVGENAFAQKIDLHVAVADVAPALIEPYDPLAVGNRRSVRLGKGSGPAGIRVKARELGLEVTDEQVPRLVGWVNEAADRRKRPVTDVEFAQAVAERIA